MSPLLASVTAAVDGWRTRAGAEETTRADFVEALRDHGQAALERSGPPTHVTASALVLDEDAEHVLLCFHGKGRFWVQPGGHLEAGDTSVEGAALRELQEETGLSPALLHAIAVADLDHHALGGGFGRCASHLDIGVIGRVSDLNAPLVVSDESDAVAWWPVAALPSDSAPGLADRLARVLAAR
ncbi:NUDIX hydrolase [Microbacterium sp. SORGH_AS_0862]|uniref:NUDIX hydrolase n=1 Tax=Microbacterium sp. SORGH_AS_0862 TaxID=3041789 RepID=UPI00278FC087|nr:NUDIX domain-containing protein [Microbacterium sp. SORGH_AS_0862]MDQ1204578.1 8-oxo-dGTP pyrophosphatase MutT (NUDIX family) [Microbacterium sp. SORGH_AS_0862]